MNKKNNKQKNTKSNEDEEVCNFMKCCKSFLEIYNIENIIKPLFNLYQYIDESYYTKSYIDYSKIEFITTYLGITVVLSIEQIFNNLLEIYSLQSQEEIIIIIAKLKNYAAMVENYYWFFIKLKANYSLKHLEKPKNEEINNNIKNTISKLNNLTDESLCSNLIDIRNYLTNLFNEKNNNIVVQAISNDMISILFIDKSTNKKKDINQFTYDITRYLYVEMINHIGLFCSFIQKSYIAMEKEIKKIISIDIIYQKSMKKYKIELNKIWEKLSLIIKYINDNYRYISAKSYKARTNKYELDNPRINEG